METETSTSTLQQIAAFCERCGQPIADREGVLHVSEIEIATYRNAEAEFDAAHPGPVTVGEIMQELIFRAEPAGWHVHHFRCVPRDAPDYDVPIERVRTWRSLCRLTADLMEKSWLPATDWQGFLFAADAGIGPLKINNEPMIHRPNISQA